MKLQMGATLQNGKYQLNQVLGRESLGATYLATQILLHQPVVIKTIDPSLQITQSFPQLKTRFTEETRLLARCQHPSIVRVLDFFQEDGLPFLVLEYIPGQTLYDRISTRNAPSLTEAEAIHYMRQIASALSVAHRNGLIHRNIRPETIVRRQGTNLGILVGFGFAHDVAIANPVEKNPFLPPDPNWNLENRFAIDLYSLAATLFFLLTGQAPDGSLSFEQYPWSPATKQALFRGLTRDSQWQLQTVDDWLRLLPNTTLPLMAANNIVQSVPPAPSQNGRSKSTAEPTLSPFPVTQNGRSTTPPAPALVPKLSTPPAQVALVSPRPRIPKVLMFTIASAGAIGLGFGLALRLNAAKSSGTTLLQPIQTFSEKEWKGTLNSSDNPSNEVPVESGTAKTDKTPQRLADPEVAQPKYTPPKIEEPIPQYTRPRRRPAIEPVEPIEPVKPAIEPSIEPSPESITPPEPVAPPITSPAPAPVKPSTREVEPTAPLSTP
ncbi:serine/threonine protein kinase [Leptolyngbya sp. NIES-2104]|uniref:serine/threonine protein kinase n=1 Tax=Leptolyngbya sp. NIES-2104 TaxID=1552121 RepID=UPI0006EC7BBA|nr:serine/threonine-protein kinase [Leptolyngbya sp. NIES-2104]GAP94506.1 serine/threonine protein kinase [Leptolyngbya sp. NIES-2104]